MSNEQSQVPVTSPSGATPPQPHPAPALPSSSNTSASANASPRTQLLDLRNVTSVTSMAPVMKERTVSSSTDRSGRATHQLMSVSPPHRLGSRSPASIPSSPTSVHSSSSAIFERDVEPSPSHPLSPHPHPSNPHRTPRSKITEAVDQGVPTVLDSAATLLATTDGELEESLIAIEAPAPVAGTSRAGSSIGSPIGIGSRSPSPTTSAGPGSRNRTSMLLNLPSPIQSSIVPLSVSPRRSPPLPGSPTRQPPPPLVTNFTASGPVESRAEQSNLDVAAEPQPPRSATPTSFGGSTHYESASSSPTTTTMERPPHPLPTPTTATFATQRTSPPRNGGIPLPAPGLTHQLSSHPPSPSNAAHKRLSFISYNDILASTPISTLPLSSLTSPGTMEPPPHIPPVSLSVNGGSFAPGFGSRSVSAAASAAGSARNSMFISGDSVLNGFRGAADVKEPDGDDDIGGEWEREGFGSGLEERLEALMAVGPGKA